VYNNSKDKSLKHPFAVSVRSTNVEYCSFLKWVAIQMYLQPSSSRSIVLGKPNWLSFRHLDCFLDIDTVQIKYTCEQSSVIKLYKKIRNLCMFRAFSFISTWKMFCNRGLNPFQKHRSQTPIPLRNITGIELNWYYWFILTKGTPLLYNKVKLTKQIIHEDRWVQGQKNQLIQLISWP